MAKRKRLPANQAQEVVVESPQVQPVVSDRAEAEEVARLAHQYWMDRGVSDWKSGGRLVSGRGGVQAAAPAIGTGAESRLMYDGKGSGVVAGREGQRPASISPAIMM